VWDICHENIFIVAPRTMWPRRTWAEIIYQNEFELIRQTHVVSPAVTWAESDAIRFVKWRQIVILSTDQFILSPPRVRPHFSSLSIFFILVGEFILNSY